MKQTSLQMLAATAAFVSSTFVATGAAALSLIPLDLDHITAGAQDIVHVVCTGNEFQPDAAVRVATVTTFMVLDSVKGAAATTFTVRQIGGELDGLAINYHVPQFAVGGEYVLFMPASSRLGLASPVGLTQGAFSVMQGQKGKEVGNGSDFATLLSSADRARAPAGIAARLQLAPSARARVDLNDFMTLLRAKVGAQ
jgi:hypothetical protein